MKRIITLSIAMVLSLALVSLISSDSSVEAQNQTGYTAGTGIIAFNATQNLSLTVAVGDTNGDGSISGNDAIVVRYTDRRSPFIYDRPRY